MQMDCWWSLALLLVSTAVEAALRCDCSRGGLTYSRVSITCERDRKAGGEVRCSNEKHGALLEGYELYKNEVTDKYRSMYRLYRTGRDWRGASAACQRDGGHLAVFDDQAELVFLASLLQRQGNNRTTAAALGLRRAGGSPDYQSVTGRQLGSLVGVNWGAGEPYDAPDRQCMMLRLRPGGGFFLSNHDCAKQEAFICEWPLSPPVLLSYSLIPGIGFYKTSPSLLPYKKAEIECVKTGGQIVVPETQKEADAMMKIFDMFPEVGQIYVGINDRSETGDFKTIHGERMSSLQFQNWAPGVLENRTATAHCVAMSSLGYYLLVDCGLPLPTVCEWPLR